MTGPRTVNMPRPVQARDVRKEMAPLLVKTLQAQASTRLTIPSKSKGEDEEGEYKGGAMIPRKKWAFYIFTIGASDLSEPLLV